MGGIGIWGMHFVGNRAVLLEHGVPGRQILYNAAYTTLSFFLPILVLLAAFYMLGNSDKAHHIHIAVAGVLTGSAVCGMHYIGQLGIDNYHCSYHVQHVVGAALIAVVASLAALSIFFRLRATWTDSWWKRALCGAILSLAVSGMHWTAAVGTIYEWKGNSAVHGHSRMQTSIIAFALVSGPFLSATLALTWFQVNGRLYHAPYHYHRSRSQYSRYQNQSTKACSCLRLL